MRRRVSILCLCFAWVCANGAVWDVVQVIAWGKMFVTYSNYLSPLKALAKTFDGSKPCELCAVAQHGKDATRDAQSPATPGGNSERLLFVSETVTPLVVVAPDYSWPAMANDSGPLRAERVSVPPPRTCCGRTRRPAAKAPIARSARLCRSSCSTTRTARSFRSTASAANAS